MAKNVFSQGKLLQAAKQVFWEGVGSILIAVGVAPKLCVNLRCGVE